MMYQERKIESICISLAAVGLVVGLTSMVMFLVRISC